jgi:hypothetical protein
LADARGLEKHDGFRAAGRWLDDPWALLHWGKVVGIPMLRDANLRES